MLVRITNCCTMECTHCMVEASPRGEHMSLETFEKVLWLHEQIDLPLIFLSGGEPTDHPEILQIIGMAKIARLEVLLLSNGEFFSKRPKLARKIQRMVRGIQVTNDERYYPREVELPEGQHCDKVTFLAPFGRAKRAGMECSRLSPFCFNLRSMTRHYRDIRQAIGHLRGMGKMCAPSINVDGAIVAGEAPSCFVLGTCESSPEELTAATCAMQCNRCGLVDQLDQKHKRAIGEAHIILASD